MANKVLGVCVSKGLVNFVSCISVFLLQWGGFKTPSGLTIIFHIPNKKKLLFELNDRYT